MDKKMAQEKTSKKKTNKVSDAKRHGIQALWAFLTNSHVSGFVTGKIYTGKLKNVCVPGLNCYSCPGAVGACPIGSLQAVVGSWNFKMAYYVIGFLIFIGAIFGRLICGFLCPFGLIQDLLNKSKIIMLKIKKANNVYYLPSSYKRALCLKQTCIK